MSYFDKLMNIERNYKSAKRFLFFGTILSFILAMVWLYVSIGPNDGGFLIGWLSEPNMDNKTAIFRAFLVFGLPLMVPVTFITVRIMFLNYYFKKKQEEYYELAYLAFYIDDAQAGASEEEARSKFYKKMNDGYNMNTVNSNIRPNTEKMLELIDKIGNEKPDEAWL